MLFHLWLTYYVIMHLAGYRAIATTQNLVAARHQSGLATQSHCDHPTSEWIELVTSIAGTGKKCHLGR